MSSLELTDEKFIELSEKIIVEKNKGNDLFKKNENELAIENYNKAIQIGDLFFKNIPDSEKKKFNSNENFQKFRNELKNAYSNLAAVYLKKKNFKEIIKIDKYIITKLDDNFDKSYVRIILAYNSLNDLINALNYYNYFKAQFDEVTNKKYEEDLKPFVEKNNQKMEELKNKYKPFKQREGFVWSLIKKMFYIIFIFGFLIGKKYYTKYFGESDEIGDFIKNTNLSYINNVTENSINFSEIKNNSDFKLNEDF